MERLGSGRRCGTREAGGRQRGNCGRSATTAPSNSDPPGGSESTRRASKRPPESSHLRKPRSTHLQKPPLGLRHEASARTNPPCSRILVRCPKGEMNASRKVLLSVLALLVAFGAGAFLGYRFFLRPQLWLASVGESFMAGQY